jgi:hypothetical protein
MVSGGFFLARRHFPTNTTTADHMNPYVFVLKYNGKKTAPGQRAEMILLPLLLLHFVRLRLRLLEGPGAGGAGGVIDEVERRRWSRILLDVRRSKIRDCVRMGCVGEGGETSGGKCDCLV